MATKKTGSIRDKLMAQAKKKISDIQASKRRFLELKVGDNLLRFFAWAADQLFYHEDRFHFFPWGGPTGRGIALTCMQEGCYGCDTAETLQEDDDEEKVKIGKQIAATSKFYYNVVDLKNPEAGMQVLSNYSQDMLSDLLALYSDGDIGDFFDPVHGRNIVIHKTDASHPRYKTTPKVKETKIQDMEWAKQAKDLRKLGSTTDNAQMKKLCAEVLGTETDEEDEEDTKQEIIESLECFSKEYRKLDTCPSCPVKPECKVAYKKRKIRLAKKKAEGTMRKKVRRSV